MAVLFDSHELPTRHADEALTALFSQGGLPIRVSHARSGVAGRTTIEHWSFADQNLFVARANSLRLARGRAEVKACAPEGIRLGYQLTGSYRLVVGEHHEAHSAGQLNITDLTQPCGFTQYGPGAAVASLEISWDHLGLSAERVRRAASALTRSPVYPLMQAHMARLCADATALGRPDIEPHIGQATLHLAQALIASAEDIEPHARAILNEALDARIVETSCCTSSNHPSPRADRHSSPHLAAAPLPPVVTQPAGNSRMDHRRAASESGGSTDRRPSAA